MLLYENNFYYSLIRTDDSTADGLIFKYTKWHSNGQMVEVGFIIANSLAEAVDRLKYISKEVIT